MPDVKKMLPKRRRDHSTEETPDTETGQTLKRRSERGKHVVRNNPVEEEPSPENPIEIESPSGAIKRADIHKHAPSPLSRFLLSFFFDGKEKKPGGLLGWLRFIRSSNQENLLGYIPVSIFASLSLLTLGLYPYIWFAQNVRAFISLSLEKIEERSLRRYAVMGFFVQSLLFLSIAMALWGEVADSPLHFEYALRFAFFYAFLSLFVLLPIRSFLYFGLRWNLRRAVAAWDHSRIMVPRTMPSWWKLFLFGSLYLQHHINRVIGLGMPGFADAEELRESLPFLEWLGGYLTGFDDSVSKGRR